MDSDANNANPERTRLANSQSSYTNLTQAEKSSGSNIEESKYLAGAGRFFRNKLESESKDASAGRGELAEGSLCPKHDAPLNFWSKKDQEY